MSEKEIDFDGDVCHYTHVHNTESGDTQKIEYVKGCKKGKRCTSVTTRTEDYEIETCQEYNELELLTLDEKCEYTSQCDSNLICKDGTCTITEGTRAYSKGEYRYCPSNYIPVFDSNTGFYLCKKQSDYTDYSTSRCYYDDEKGHANYFAPEFSKVCGEIKFYKTETISPKYINNIKEISTASIGSLADGTYVADARACESGFTLKYYPDKQLEPKENDQSSQYSRCVTIDEVDVNNGYIKYSLDGKEYKVKYYNIMDNNVNINHIKIKLDMFKKFKDKMDKCKSEKYKDDLFKCEDRDVQEYLFFYRLPEYYILYKDEGQVMDYLLNGQYNSISFIILLFFLFLI